MVASLKPLPPSGRDFEAYCQVSIHGATTRETAQSLQISQTRVCQIVRKVSGFLKETVPLEAGEEDSKQLRQSRIAIAEYVAGARVDFLYGKALRAWDSSLGEQKIAREVSGGNCPPVKTITTKTSCGDIRYLLAAARLAVFSSRLPASDLAFGWDGEEEVEETEDRYVLAAEVASPPEEACSTFPARKLELPELGRPAKGVSLFDDGVCDDELELGEFLVNESPRSVQNKLEYWLSDHPENPAAEGSGRLSREQRRTRQRILDKKRKAK